MGLFGNSQTNPSTAQMAALSTSVFGSVRALAPTRTQRPQSMRMVTSAGGVILSGKVTSTGMEKTAVVMVERRQPHPKYRKMTTKSEKYLIHDEENSLKVGDLVRIESTGKALSAKKRFSLIEICPPAGCGPQ